MRAFGRIVGSFFALLVIGYLAMVAFLPPPPPVAADELMSGRSASVRLSQEAGLLMNRKPAAPR